MQCIVAARHGQPPIGLLQQLGYVSGHALMLNWMEQRLSSLVRCVYDCQCHPRKWVQYSLSLLGPALLLPYDSKSAVPEPLTGSSWHWSRTCEPSPTCTIHLYLIKPHSLPRWHTVRMHCYHAVL